MNKDVPNKPIETFNALGISVKVFENVSDKGAHYDRVQIVRTYRDGDTFKTTSTFSVEELPIVESFARKAYELCLSRRTEAQKNRSQN